MYTHNFVFLASDYTEIGGDEELPLGEEFQEHLRRFLRPSEKKVEKKLELMKKLVTQLSWVFRNDSIFSYLTHSWSLVTWFQHSAVLVTCVIYLKNQAAKWNISSLKFFFELCGHASNYLHLKGICNLLLQFTSEMLVAWYVIVYVCSPVRD